MADDFDVEALLEAPFKKEVNGEQQPPPEPTFNDEDRNGDKSEDNKFRFESFDEMRPKGTVGRTPGFTVLEVKPNVYHALCEICNNAITNTAKKRLEQHRQFCIRRNSDQNQTQSNSNSMIRSTTSSNSNSSDAAPRSKRSRRVVNYAAGEGELINDSEILDDPPPLPQTQTAQNHNNKDDDDDDDHDRDPDYNPSLDEYDGNNTIESMEVLFAENGEEIMRNISVRSSNPLPCTPPTSGDESLRSQSSRNRRMFDVFNRGKSNISSNSSSSLNDSSRSQSITSETESGSTTSSSVSPSPVLSKRNKKQQSMQSFADKVTKAQSERITAAVGDFFFACNIPFNVVTSKYFENMIRELRPGFVQHIPGRKKLSTTVLDDRYKHHIESVNAKRPNVHESVMLIDGWKNSSSNEKTVVTMLHTVGTENIFLQAFDITGSSETGVKLEKIVQESEKIANEKFGTNVYAVLSDNASTMKLMGNLTALWHSTCKSHTGNLLAKDLVDKDLKTEMLAIIREFKQPDFENYIIKLGGLKMISPGDTRWCSYRDAYRRVIVNLPHMKRIMLDGSNIGLKKTVKANVQKLIIDDAFIQKVKDQIELLNPVCEVINFCQKKDCSLADGTSAWFNLKLPSKYDNNAHVQNVLNLRKAMALDVYSQTAYYLHPKYHVEATEKIDTDDFPIVQDFVIENLDAKGIESWSMFINKECVFNTLFLKKVVDPTAFWTVAAAKHPNLSKFALKLLRMPASTAQLERLFSHWHDVHSLIRNRLKFERSKKLAAIYYTLRSVDNLLSEEESDCENENESE
ncbi:uncharacterized protein LOC135846571 isoform X2 [Planococcus citri]